MIERAGELAALGTASCWVVTALSFEAAGKRIGSLSVNLIRLVMAFVPLSLYGLLVRGVMLPVDAEPRAWGWLGLSGMIGFVIGDLCLFRAFVMIGPRLSTLIMASVPVWTAGFGFVVLGEILGAQQWLGMALTVGGIGWAISQRPPPEPETSALPIADPQPIADPPEADPIDRFSGSGVALAIGGALGQAGGLVLSKYGMGSYDAFAATQIRVLAGILGFALVVTASGWWPRLIASLRDRRAMVATGLGATFGPFLGVGLSLLAVQLAPTGVAAALMATTPILMLPVSKIRGEPIGWAGGLGAVIAVAGVALLLL